MRDVEARDFSFEKMMGLSTLATYSRVVCGFYLDFFGMLLFDIGIIQLVFWNRVLKSLLFLLQKLIYVKDPDSQLFHVCGMCTSIVLLSVWREVGGRDLEDIGFMPLSSDLYICKLSSDERCSL